MLSREGPRASVADVNGDGMEDIYIGGTLKSRDNCTPGRRNGFIMSTALSTLLKDFEDYSSVFFDVDKDGDKDFSWEQAEIISHPSIKNCKIGYTLTMVHGNFSL